MTDIMTNRAILRAHNPNSPGEDTHATEWSFDLDEALVPDKDPAHADHERSGANDVSTESAIDAWVDVSVANGSDDIDAQAVSDGKYEPVTQLENENMPDDGHNMDLAATQDNATLNQIFDFQEDTLIFDADALIG